MDFQPPLEPEKNGIFSIIAQIVRVISGKSGDAVHPKDILGRWTISDATGRILADSQGSPLLARLKTPLFPHVEALPEKAKKVLLDAISDYNRQDDNSRILFLDISYERALTQFLVSWNLLVAFGFLVVSATMFIVNFIINLMTVGMLERRLGQYTLFSTFGFSQKDLRAMVLTQVAVSATAGVLVALTVVPAASWLVDLLVGITNWQQATYRNLGFEYAEGIVLHPSATQYAGWSFGLVLIFVLLAWRNAKALGITSVVYPADLVFVKNRNKTQSAEKEQ